MNLFAHPTYLCSGLFSIFLVILEIEIEVFLKGLVKFMEIGNFEYLMLFKNQNLK